MSKADLFIDAARDGDLPTVRRLITEGVNVNARGFFKVTALMNAITGGHENVVRFLLEQPTLELNALNSGGTSALMIAARLGNVKAVQLLLTDARTDPNLLGKWGGTAMINAAGFGQMAAVKELLKVENISLEATYTDKKYSPLTLARHNGYEDIAKILEEHISTKHTKQAGSKPPRPTV